MDDSTVDTTAVFAASVKGLIEAPAGYGKTYLIVDFLKTDDVGRQLVLTHTIAGVAVLRDRIPRTVVGGKPHVVSTIAGWVQKYVLAYAPLVGLTKAELVALEKTSPREYWDKLYDAFATLLSNPHVRYVIAQSYAGICVDEYQDCNQKQHRVLVLLSEILPVRIVGDPMQGIFDFNGDKVPWNDVTEAFELLGTLDTPHRWNQAGNHSYGAWVDGVRRSMVAGSKIDLRAAVPTCVQVVIIPTAPADYQAAIISASRRSLPDGHHRLIIGDKHNMRSKELVKRLSRPRYHLLESLYSADMAKLKALGATLDTTQADDQLLIFGILENCLSGITQSIKDGAKKLRRHDTYSPQAPIVRQLEAMQQAVAPPVALTLMADVEAIVGVSCSRRLPLQILKTAFISVASGSHSSYEDAVVAAISSLSHMGRMMPRYAVGSTLLVKGLEVEEVIIINAHEMAKNDLYVALSRPINKLTIFTNSYDLLG